MLEERVQSLSRN